MRSVKEGSFYGTFDPGYIDGRWWYLQNPDNQWGYVTKGGIRISPNDGFVFDFASVPRLLWPIFPPTGDGPRKAYGPAACMHDHMYRHHQFSKARTEQLFLEMMNALNVRFTARVCIYLGPKLFGFGAWKKQGGVDVKVAMERAAAISADLRNSASVGRDCD